MTDRTQESRLQKTTINFLTYYGFESEGRPIEGVMADWVGCYPSRWILAASIEALYQGRYKTISVEQILIIWQRRGRPLHHFNGEFERIVCNHLWGQSLNERWDEEILVIDDDDDGMEYDRRLSELLSDDNSKPIAVQLSTARTLANSSFQTTTMIGVDSNVTSNLQHRSHPIKHVDFECHKVPHPIHQFTPGKTSPNVYNKLRAIALRAIANPQVS